MLQLPSVYLSVLGFGMLLISGTCFSQTVYQIEVILFERTAATGDESWPKNLTLEYPQPWQRLFNPQEEAARQAALAQEDSLRLSDDFLRTLAQESVQLQAEATTTGTGAPPPEATATTATLPEFFAFLPPEKRGLQKTREALDRSHQLRVLFHETWRQPLTAIEQSPALILHGGNRYGAHYELQGYIHLGISRFLHLHTNLWFTHFAPNHGQTPEHWPSLPEEPAELSSSEQEKTEAETTEADARSSEEWPADPTMGVDANLAEAPYVINQIVTLQQKRRLRSGELHYLDHPRLGVLIKMTPEK